MKKKRDDWKEVEEYLKKHDSVLIVTGSTENHGKHMPLGTDTMIPSKIAEMLEEKYGSAFIIKVIVITKIIIFFIQIFKC